MVWSIVSPDSANKFITYRSPGHEGSDHTSGAGITSSSISLRAFGAGHLSTVA
jgi:hypothetical protein